ncbi:MAG: hypothetical protein L6R36_002274 [Xanthoria steineri]|nr:MAG: hypothetical protein L6R36_002274 [Xanthoria steineri]
MVADPGRPRFCLTFCAIYATVRTAFPWELAEYQWAKVRDDREFVAAISVLMVRTGEFHDWKAGPIDFAPIEPLSEKVDENPHVRRINLGDAVDFILDMQRRNGDLLYD